MDPTDVAFAGIARQAELIAGGELSARELLEIYLERIARIGPRLNAFRVVFADSARKEAERADASPPPAGTPRPPLLGVPIAVKDDVDVAGEVTAMGTRAHGPPAERDAEVVRRLRDAGAVIVGKTNVPELCIWPFTESATWGITRNPWGLNRTPGGSSGGSAAAVAAGLVGAALGSDGGGSIRIPAAWCGLYGLKPQRARVPLAPRPEAWHGLSVNGGLTRTVTDSALLYDVIAGGPPDPGGPAPPARSFLEAARGEPPALRIAVSTRVAPGLMAPLHPQARAGLAETVELLRSLGHRVEERELDLRPWDLPAFLARYLRGIHDDAAALPHPERLERRTRAMAGAGGRLPKALVARVRARESEMATRLNAVLRDHDVLLTPATAVPPPPVGRFEGRGWLWTFNGVGAQVPYTALWNATGQPACSVPAGFDDEGLPRSVQLVGRPGDEVTLLGLSAQLERARPWAGVRPALAA
jgi:amidase